MMPSSRPLILLLVTLCTVVPRAPLEGFQFKALSRTNFKISLPLQVLRWLQATAAPGTTTPQLQPPAPNWTRTAKRRTATSAATPTTTTTTGFPPPARQGLGREGAQRPTAGWPADANPRAVHAMRHRRVARPQDKAVVLVGVVNGSPLPRWGCSAVCPSRPGVVGRSAPSATTGAPGPRGVYRG